MPKYRKKPVEVYAIKVSDYIKLNFEDFDGARSYQDKNGNMRFILLREDRKSLLVQTLEGEMVANENDYLITGVNGERYPCKPDIFEQTYELVK